MKKLIHSLLLLLLLGGFLPSIQAQQLVVAQNGSGKFRTIQAAINSLPNEAAKPRVILIKNGTYREKLFIDGKSNITLKGQSEKGTIITISQARDAWRCDPVKGADDWGVATLNMRNSPDITPENLTFINSYGFDAKGEITINCPADPSGTKVVQKDGHQMVMRTFAGATRITVRHCTFRALGGDTVSPWDTEGGMFYFQDCTLEGGVDFYCPRGWAYIENSRFICHNMSAAIWHDGSGNRDSKTVLKNCTFEGDDNFKLGRYHRESQFYVIDCKFPKNMADADIYHASSGPGTPNWGRRVYYSGCHREGGDFAWLEAVQLTGYAVKLINAPQKPTGKDRVLVPEPGSVIWARFYDLEINKPIYVGRDGLKKAALAEIENERRAGYAYAGTWPAKLLAKEYPRWQQKWANPTGAKL